MNCYPPWFELGAVLILVFNFVSAVVLIDLNKWVFSRVDFGYPAALSNVHYLVSWACLPGCGSSSSECCSEICTVSVLLSDCCIAIEL